MDNNAYQNSAETEKDCSRKTSLKVETEPSKHTFDEAVELLGCGKFHYLHLLVCGMCVSAFICETLGVSVIMMSANCDLNFTIYEQGMLASAGFLGVVLSAHAMGLLSDTFGRNKTLRYSVMMATICSVVSAFSPNVWMLITMRFLVGVSVNACQSCVFSYLGEFHGNKSRAKFVTLLNIFFAVGSVYFPSIAIAILPQEYDIYLGTLKLSSWRVCLLLSSLPTFFAAITVPFFPESPKLLLVQEKHDEAVAVLRKVYGFNTGKSEDSFPVQYMTTHEDVARDLTKVKSISEAFSIIWHQTKPLFSKSRRWTTITLSIYQFMIFFICHGSFMWIPGLYKPVVEYSNSSLTVCEAFRQYAIKVRHLNETNLELQSGCLPTQRADTFVLQIIIALGILFAIPYIVFAFLTNLIGKEKILLSWMLVCTPAMVALIWTRGSTLNILLLFFLMLFGNSAGVVTAITVGFYPTNISGMAICLIMMMGRLGSFVGSNTIGIILSYRCEYFFTTLGLLAAFLIILWIFIPKEKRNG